MFNSYSLTLSCFNWSRNYEIPNQSDGNRYFNVAGGHDIADDKNNNDCDDRTIVNWKLDC